MYGRLTLAILLLASSLALGTANFFYTTLSDCISKNGTPVLGLSSETNAHVEVGGENMDYNQLVLCFIDKFVKNFSIVYGDCSENVILRLYSSKNSHAEIPEGSVYLNKICIESENLSITCGKEGAYENYTIRLSSDYNAHAELPNLSNYPILVGCNVSYKDGTICEKDRNCLSNNCAENIEGSISVCAPSGFCYDNGSFFENTSCHLGNLCWNEEWVSDGDFNEMACNCSTNGNSTWMGLCCGDDPEENARAYKKNYDFDLYLDEKDWKSGKEIIGSYYITKNCFSDFCIVPDGNVTINNTKNFTRDFLLGFLMEKEENGEILKKGNLSVSVTNGRLNVGIGDSYITGNLSEGWNYIVIYITNNSAKVYINGEYLGKIATNGLSKENMIIYSKIDELFLIGRAVDSLELDEILNLFGDRGCIVGGGCRWNNETYQKGKILNGYNCSGRYWDKIPEVELFVYQNPVVLDVQNSTNITIRILDDDAREIEIENITIADPLGNEKKITGYNTSVGRKVLNITFEREFKEEGYYDIIVKIKDRNSVVKKRFEDAIYVAKSAGTIERVYVYPKVILPGENITIVVTMRNNLYNISAGTEFNITLRDTNYTVLKNAKSDKSISVGERINLTFIVKINTEKIVQEIIPELHFFYNGSSLVVTPKLVRWEINTEKRIYKKGEKIKIIGYPHLMGNKTKILTNTTVRIFNSNYKKVLEKNFENIDNLNLEIPTDNLPCDLYIISIYSESGNYSGEIAIPIVLTGCYV